MMPFLGPGLRFQACKQNSYSEKDRNQTSGRNIHPTKCGGVAKSWLVHTALPFCTEIFLLAPIHFVGFCKTARFIATNSQGGSPYVDTSTQSMHKCLHTQVRMYIYTYMHTRKDAYRYDIHACIRAHFCRHRQLQTCTMCTLAHHIQISMCAYRADVYM